LSVYKRGTVYWYEFWFRGQRIRESSGLTNKVAAQQAESIRKAGLAEGRAGIAGPKPVVNFGDFVRNEFLPWAEKQYHPHPRTYERYRESTKLLLTCFEKLRLDAVSMALVEKFKITRSTDIAPATVNRDLAALRLILNLAIRKEYIAKNPVKEPLTTVRKAHHLALRMAKMAPPFRLYDFRHTFGSRTAMAGVDLPTLKELMGHADISTTMRYVHPTPEHKREAVRKLENYNRNQVFALYEPLGSPQKSPQ
jgi:site-specific recombinase XerD